MLKGRVFHSPLLMARVLGGQTDTRISAAAPIKIYKKAVERNKVRRKIYNALRIQLAGVGSIKDGTHVVVFAKAGISEAAQEEIAAELKTLFVKAGVLR